MDEEYDDPRLAVAVEALRRIVGGDPGPAYWIARAALEEMGVNDEE